MISDFGLSTILIPGTQGQQSICGTPLYSAPQLLRKRSYTYKVDVWALGIMCFEMITGKTPFHSFEMKDLIQKINRGDYILKLELEPIALEAALFLSQTLQANEDDRLNAEQLMDHKFLTKDLELDSIEFTELDLDMY